MKYRKDIDGLRALAVVPVLVFHAHEAWAPGGFFGVDVFFVISGYLITGIILGDLAAGRFSVKSFYAKRIRRLMPALYLVILFTIPLAWVVMLPDALENFGQSIVATVLFSNNILLTLTTGYWDLSAQFKPLLHTWSLGVEEQFYLFYPVMLMAIFWIGTKLRVVAVTLVCLGTMVIFNIGFFTDFKPETIFYLAPFRLWEFAIGAITLFVSKKLVANLGHALRKFFVNLAIMTLLMSYMVFTAEASQPSLLNIVPALAAAVIIAFHEDLDGRLMPLTWRPVVIVGLMSYSIYLWHQPIFALWRTYSINEPPQAEMGMLCVLIIGISACSWRYIERPLRDRKLVGDLVFFPATFILAVCLLLFGMYLHVTAGAPERVFSHEFKGNDFHISYNESARRYETNFSRSGAVPKVVVAGHSYARDFVNVLDVGGVAERIDLVYKRGFDACSKEYASGPKSGLFQASDFIFVTSGFSIENFQCISSFIKWAEKDKKKLVFVGEKYFGYNINWITRVENEAWPILSNQVPKEFIASERLLRDKLPDGLYLPIQDAFMEGGMVLITDENGELLTADRYHLTRAGAVFLAGSLEDLMRTNLGWDFSAL